VYVVVWQVLSAVDGHVTTGSFPFAIGVDLVEADAPRVPPAVHSHVQVEYILRWLAYLAVVSLTGGTLFGLAVWYPSVARISTRDAGPVPEHPWSSAVSIFLVVLLGTSAAGLPVQAGKVSGVWAAAPWSVSVHELLIATRFGVLWLARVALVLALTGFSFIGSARARALWTLGLTVPLMMTFSLGSHAAAGPRAGLPLALDWLHLAAASVWVGGLFRFYLANQGLTSYPASLRTEVTAHMIPRFSALALLSVGTLAVTGAYAALQRVGEPGLLTTTAYGWMLLFKLALAAPMLMLGAINLLIVRPRIRRAASAGGDPGLVGKFQSLVSAEAHLGWGVLLAVALLTSLPPARPLPPDPALVRTARAEDLRLRLEVDPARVGLNSFRVAITAGGRPLDDALLVRLAFRPQSGRLPPSQVDLEHEGGGVYRAQGGFISLAEPWTVHLTVRRRERFDVFADFLVEPQGSASGRGWEPAALGLILIVAVAHVWAARRPPWRQGLPRAVVRYLPAMILLAATLGVLPQRIRARGPSEVINPVVASSQSIARGRALYEQHCAACHGETGKGDGPIGAALRPPPADLTLHAAPGVHPDGQLFDWISRGFPGSIMPAFESQLEEEDRWHLVNYLRALAGP
jgi:copper transport protein